MKQAKESESFKDFTNLYSLTKTLRFELKPVLKTKSLAKIIEEDQNIDELYHKEMKPMFDILHERFVTESLQEAKLPLALLKTVEKNFLQLHDLKQAAKTNRDKIYALENRDGEMSEAQKKLRAFIVGLFQKQGKKWKEEKYAELGLKNEDYSILTEEKVLEILAQENPEKKEDIEKFKRFFTYFSGFNQNRTNYYSPDTKKTAVASRIIDENLFRFLDNKRDFEILSKKISDLKKYKNYFQLENYQNFLAQKNIETFNIAIGEINRTINLFSQQNKDALSKKYKFKILYKQIGCGKSKFSMLTIKEGEEWQKIDELINSKQEDEKNSQLQLVEKVKVLYEEFFTAPDSFEMENIYFNKSSINIISDSWFVSWHQLADLLKAKKIIKNRDKNTGEYTLPTKISLAELKEVLETEKDSVSLFKRGKVSEKESKKEISRGEYEKLYADNAWETLLKIWRYETKNNFAALDGYLQEFEIIKKEKFDKQKKSNDKSHINFIKDICDAFLAVERMLRFNKVEEKNTTDDNFYATVDEYLQETRLREYYDAFRNYLTKKPFDESKIQLNFKKGGRLLTGWSDDKNNDHTFQYGATFLSNNGKYYLAIIINNDAFSKKANPEVYSTNLPQWQLMASKLLKATTIYGSSYLGKYGGDYASDKLKLSPETLITRIKSILKEKVPTFPELQDIINQNWAEPNELAKKIGEKSYFNPNFINIDEAFVKKLVSEEKIYLLEIVNHDLSTDNKNPNIHTLYFNELFTKQNIEAKILKLDANAKIFYRKASEGLPIREKKGKEITFIDKRDGNKTKKVISNRRYATDKYIFHFPIKINFSKGSLRYKLFNEIINKSLSNQPVTVLGIDRGEKNLMYYSLINQEGKLLKQGSFNEIYCGDKLVNYNALLSQRAQEMKEARQSWEAIGKIKDLKEGYLSQVVHEIYNLIIENNAIIVMEDLNSEFKAKRTAKVEKSVYKKFELALAKKLNHLVLKNKRPEELGGVLNAYQLTPAIEAGKIAQFEKSKQWGIMYYVRPDYTSAIDPLTGWRKEIYIPNSLTDAKAKEEWRKSKIEILFDTEQDYFKFHYGKWDLCAYEGIERLYWKRNEKNASGTMGTMKRYDLHEELDKLFKDIDKKQDINTQLFQRENFTWSSLIFYWNLLNQIRNSDKAKEGNGNDFIQSPVWSDRIKGFYDSREVYREIYPDNGDANGAYNIARKGLILLNRIKEDPEKPVLYIANTEWDTFTQKK